MNITMLIVGAILIAGSSFLLGFTAGMMMAIKEE